MLDCGNMFNKRPLLKYILTDKILSRPITIHIKVHLGLLHFVKPVDVECIGSPIWLVIDFDILRQTLIHLNVTNNFHNCHVTTMFHNHHAQ